MKRPVFSYYTGMFRIKLFLIPDMYREYMFELISGRWQAWTWSHGIHRISSKIP